LSCIKALAPPVKQIAGRKTLVNKLVSPIERLNIEAVLRMGRRAPGLERATRFQTARVNV
jgi:hypothetical protein